MPRPRHLLTAAAASLATAGGALLVGRARSGRDQTGRDQSGKDQSGRDQTGRDREVADARGAAGLVGGDHGDIASDQTSPEPDPLLDDVEDAGDVDLVDDADPASDHDGAVEEAPATVTPSSEGAEVVAGPRAGGRLRTVAGAVSMLAAGALATLLVLSLTGALSTPSAAVDGVEVVFGDADLGDEADGGAGADGPTDSPGDNTAGEEDRADGTGQDGTGQDASDPGATSAGVEGTADADGAVEQVAVPTTIRIPSIGVEAGVIPLGTTDGVLDVPEDFARTGWWTDGPEPGEVGPSVIVGHVDSYEGPAVFFQLDQLTYDDRIEVVRGDGTVAVFAVRSALQVDKDAFPTEAVYGPTDDAQLRLITCHGDFTDGSYLGNYIVMADLVEETAAPTAGALF